MTDTSSPNSFPDDNEIERIRQKYTDKSGLIEIEGYLTEVLSHYIEQEIKLNNQLEQLLPKAKYVQPKLIADDIIPYGPNTANHWWTRVFNRIFNRKQ
ncbi:MAG: hypothetical protein ABGY11_00010 [Candidatus Thioglobus sp.]